MNGSRSVGRGTKAEINQNRYEERWSVMAWNPSPKVAAARDYGQKFGADQVIIIAIDNRRETIEAISYGETKRLCAETKGLADVAYKAVCDSL